MNTRKHPIGLWLCSFLFFGLALLQPAHSQVYNRFGPANGILVGDTSTYNTTAADASDVISLWSGTCNASTFLRGDGSCQVAGPASSSAVIAFWTGTCDATTFLRGDGACVTVGGGAGGSDTQVQYNDGGAFGGDAGLTYNEGTDTLTAGALVGDGSGLTNLDAGDISAGTLAVARGGTGVTSSTGTGSVVLSASPTLTGTLTAATISATAATVGGSAVCRADGTNCPSSGGALICRGSACNVSTLAVGQTAIVQSTVDASRTNSTYAADSVLQFTNIPNGAEYTIDAVIGWHQSGATANGIKVAFAGTSSSVPFYCRTTANTSAANTSEVANGTDAGNELAFTAGSGGAIDRQITCEGTISAFGASATAYLMWAQQTTNASATVVMARSYLRITRLL